MTAFQNEKRVCRKSSVYNQTGQTYFQQLSAYNRMSAHLRRILLAPCAVDSRNKRYTRDKGLGGRRFSSRSKSLDKIRMQEDIIDGIAYDTEHHPLEALRMSLECTPECHRKVKRVVEVCTRCNDWSAQSHAGRMTGSVVQRMAINSEADGAICPCLRSHTCKPCSTTARKLRGSAKLSRLSDSTRRVGAPLVANRSELKRSVNDKSRTIQPALSPNNVEEAEPSYSYDSSFESSSEISSAPGSPVLKKSENIRAESPANSGAVLGRQSNKFSGSVEQAEEAKYAKFIYDITQEIMFNGLYTDHELNAIFKKHIAINSDTLDRNKMQSEIYQLKISLNVRERSDDEEDDDIEQYVSSGRFAKLSPEKPPTPPKILDENKLAEKLRNHEASINFRETRKPRNSHGKNTVVLVDANPELLITERDVLLTLMEMKLDPRQIQSICKSLQNKSRETALPQTVQVDAETSYPRGRQDRANSPINSRIGSRAIDFYHPHRDRMVQTAAGGARKTQYCQCNCRETYTNFRYSPEESQTEVQPEIAIQTSPDGSQGDKNRVASTSRSLDGISEISIRTRSIGPSRSRKIYGVPEIDEMEAKEENINHESLLKSERVSRESSRALARLASIKSRKKLSEEYDTKSSQETMANMNMRRSTLTIEAGNKSEDDSLIKSRKKLSEEYDEKSSQEKMANINMRRSTSTREAGNKSEDDSLIKSRKKLSEEYDEKSSQEKMANINTRRSTSTSEAGNKSEDDSLIKSRKKLSEEYDEKSSQEKMANINMRRSTSTSEAGNKSEDDSLIKSRKKLSEEYDEKSSQEKMANINTRRSTSTSEAGNKREDDSLIKSRKKLSEEYDEKFSQEKMANINTRRSTSTSEAGNKSEDDSLIKSRKKLSEEYDEKSSQEKMANINMRRSTSTSEAGNKSEDDSLIKSRKKLSEEYDEKSSQEKMANINMRRSKSKSQARNKSEDDSFVKSRESQSEEYDQEEEEKRTSKINMRRSTSTSQAGNRSEDDSSVKSRESRSEEYDEEEKQKRTSKINMSRSTSTSQAGDKSEDDSSVKSRESQSEEYDEEEEDQKRTSKINIRRSASTSQAGNRSKNNLSVDSRENRSEEKQASTSKMNMRKSTSTNQARNSSKANLFIKSRESRSDEYDEEKERDKTSKMNMRRSTFAMQAGNRGEDDSFVESRGESRSEDKEQERMLKMNLRRRSSTVQSADIGEDNSLVENSESRNEEKEQERISIMQMRRRTSTIQRADISEDDSSPVLKLEIKRELKEEGSLEIADKTPKTSEESVKIESTDSHGSLRLSSENPDISFVTHSEFLNNLRTDDATSLPDISERSEGVTEEIEKDEIMAIGSQTTPHRSQTDDITDLELGDLSEHTFKVNKEPIFKESLTSIISENSEAFQVPSLPEVTEVEEVQKETSKELAISAIEENFEDKLSPSSIQQDFEDSENYEDSDENERVVVAALKSSSSLVLLSKMSSRLHPDIDTGQGIVADKETSSPELTPRISSSQDNDDDKSIESTDAKIGMIFETNNNDRSPKNSEKKSLSNERYSRKVERKQTTSNSEDKIEDTGSMETGFEQLEIRSDIQAEERMARVSSYAKNSNTENQDGESRESYELGEKLHRNPLKMGEISKSKIGIFRTKRDSSRSERKLSEENIENLKKQKGKKSICSICFSRLIVQRDRQRNAKLQSGAMEMIGKKSQILEENKERRGTTSMDDLVTTASDISLLRKQLLNNSAQLSIEIPLDPRDHRDVFMSSNSRETVKNTTKSNSLANSHPSMYLEARFASGNLKQKSEAISQRQKSIQSKKRVFLGNPRSSMYLKKESNSENLQQRPETTLQHQNNNKSRNSITKRLIASVENLIKCRSKSTHFKEETTTFSSSNVSSMNTTGSQSSRESSSLSKNVEAKLPSILAIKTQNSSCACILASKLIQSNRNENCRVDCIGRGFVRDQHCCSFHPRPR